MKSVSLRRNFVWNFVGNLVYNVAQLLLIVALARLGSVHMVGQFALMLAIAAPIYMAIGLNLRVVRATDVRRVWSPKQYYALRQILNIVSLALTMVVGLALGIRGAAILALFFVGMSKSVESTSQMLYGFFQVRERLDLVARSFLLRALLGAAGFVAMLALTRDLAPACAGLVVAWFFTWLVHDRPQERRLLATENEAMRLDGTSEAIGGGTILSLARKAAPLGIDAGVGSFATNVPRYAVQISLGTAQLGVFAPLAYGAQIVSMITGAMGDTVVGRLAKQVDRGDSKAFTRLLLKLVSFGVVVALFTVLAAWLLGEWAVRLVLGEQYVNQSVLILLLLGAGAITMQRSLARGIQAAHLYSAVLLVDSVIMVSSVALAAFLVPAYGLTGAAAVLGLSFLTGIAFSLVILYRFLKRMGTRERESDLVRIGLRISPRSSGGGRAFVENLIPRLAEVEGCDEVYVFIMGDAKSSVFEVSNQIFVPVPANPLGRMLFGPRALARAVEKHPVDFLIAPGNEVSRVPGTPTLMWPLTVAPFEEAAMSELGRSAKERARWRFLRHSIRVAARNADGFIFSSHYARALYRESVPAVRDAFSTVIAPAATLPAGTKASPHPVMPEKYLLFVSHLYPYKMVVEMIEGFAIAQQRGLRHHLVIAGNRVNPAYAAQIDATIEALGIGEFIHLLGGVPQSELPALYMGADVFLFPSLSENAGSFAVIDAFTFGVPVLASCMSSIPEACQDAARYFDPRDPEHLANEILRLTGDPRLRDDLVRRSKVRAGEYHSWSEIAEGLVAFTQQVRQDVRRRGSGEVEP